MRLDKWLWYARFFKSRALASRFCEQIGLRVNGARVAKPHHAVRPGDVLTLAIADVRVVRILALPTRRGPAPEARACYDVLPESAPSIDAGAPSA
jgi:ribosome-associated heat shock protein Hsp15